MKINYLKTVGFRKFKDTFETELYDVTNITGKNKSGKSNVLYAIINTLLGTNLSGDEKTCLINQNCNSSYGELHFTDNAGRNHVLIRGKDRINSKNNILQLDGKNVTQMELTSFYKDKKLFLSIINPLYFLNKKPAEQKELVDKYLADISPKEIFDSLDAQQKQILLNKYYKEEKKFEELTEQEQTEFVNLTMFNIFLDISYYNLSDEEKKLLEGLPKDIPTFISELNSNIKMSESIIASLNGKIEYALKNANEEVPKKTKFEKEEELVLARQELDFLNNNTEIVQKENQKKIVESIEKNILDKETELQELKNNMEKGKKIYYELKNGNKSICPMCEQPIQNENLAKTLSNMKKDLTEKYDKHNLLETEIKDMKLKETVEKCKYHSLEGQTTIDKSKRIDVIKNTIKELEQREKDIIKYNSEIEIKQKNIELAKVDIKKFENEKQKHMANIENLKSAKKVALKLYISYIESKMKLAKKYLKDVDIRFYSILKTTGEIKDDFIITYKNKPLSDLSKSETFATALEFANMFNQISRGNFPIFIDDYESYADYDFIKEYSKYSQLFISKVEKGTELKISNANGNNSNTINTISELNNAVIMKNAA